MKVRAVSLTLLAITLSIATVDADVTIRGRTVTTEAARGGGGMAALGALLGRGRGGGGGGGGGQTTTDEFVIYVKDGRMRMDSGQHTLVLDPRPGQAPTMLMLDHAGRQAMVMTLEAAAAADTASDMSTSGATVTPAGGARQILGYDTTSYNFSVAIQSGMLAAGPAGAMPKATNEGVAWIAPNTPGLDELREFYRSLAAGVKQLGGGLATAGLAASQAALTELGMPLETTTKTSASIEMGGAVMPVASSTATSTVTSISVDAVTVDFFENGPPAGYSLMQMPAATGMAGRTGAPSGNAMSVPCDCSCEALAEYRKLEAEAKRGNKEAEAELKKRMSCVMQCVMQWAACGRR